MLMKLELSRLIFEESSNCIKLCSVEAELFHMDGRTDGRDEPYTRFSHVCEHA